MPDTTGWPFWAVLVLSVIVNLFIVIRAFVDKGLPVLIDRFMKHKGDETLRSQLRIFHKEESSEELTQRLIGWILDDFSAQLDRINETMGRVASSLAKLESVVRREGKKDGKTTDNKTTDDT